MKIILEQNDLEIAKKRIEIETDAEVIHDVMKEIRGALIAYGFHPNTVKDGILSLAEEYKNDN